MLEDVRSHQFIGELAQALNQKIKGYTISVCFSQNKDELIIGLCTTDKDFYVIADLVPDVSLLYFPESFQRAKRNSIDLFPEIISLKILKVVPHYEERSFHFELENNFQLLFKMHGRNSNVLVLRQNKVLSLFKNNLENDWHVSLELLNKKKAVDEIAKGDPLKHNNVYFEHFRHDIYLKTEKDAVLKTINSGIKKSEAFIRNTKIKLDEIFKLKDYEKIANIIMANIHLEVLNEPFYSFYDFYDDKDITIKLKKDLSLQKNAEIYYKKGRNRKLEIDTLKRNMEEKSAILQKFQSLIIEITAIEDIKLLRQSIKQNNLQVSIKEKDNELPFRNIDVLGFQILLGRNAINNDLLTLKYAFKEDLWLHAKDVSGSHVVIKYQAGKNFPKPVIERAAQLAAFYSKRKNDSLVPVSVTPKKFVRKPKGFAPGKVIVEREEVILVEPKDFE